METAILAVAVLGVLAIIHTQWMVRNEIADAKSRLLRELRLIDSEIRDGKALGEESVAIGSEIKDVLKEASKISASRSQPRGDKIPLTETVGRYVPVSIRRRQAEAASMGPQTHRDQVIANDTKAMQSVG